MIGGESGVWLYSRLSDQKRLMAAFPCIPTSGKVRVPSLLVGHSLHDARSAVIGIEVFSTLNIIATGPHQQVWVVIRKD
jgi:hypothetical protein